MAADRIKTPELEERLAAKYAQPEYVMLWEVRDSTGAGAGREADALAFSVWPSRGLRVIGFEIKSDRRDWLRELKNPLKAEGFASTCDEWWLVTAPDVARPEEIPPTWGWWVAHGRGLKAMKVPPARETPANIGRPLLMSIVRQVANGYVRKSKLDELVKAQTAEAIEAAKKSAEDAQRWKVQDLEEKARRYREALDKFNAASGIDLMQTWTFPAGEVGQLVKALLDRRLRSQLNLIRDSASKVAEALSLLEQVKIFDEPKQEAGT